MSDLFSAFAEVSLDANHDPISVVAPNFYLVDGWAKNPVGRKGRAGPVRWWGRVGDLNKRLNAQIKWSDGRNRKDNRGVTSRVMDAVNGSRLLGRTILLIHPSGIDHGSIQTALQGSTFIRFEITNDTIHRYAAHARVSDRLELVGKFRKGQRRDAKVIEEEAPSNISQTVPHTPSSGAHGNALRTLGESLAPYVDDHALYIDADHSLIYTFSNIVQVGASQKGCGGLFLVVRNEALKSIGEWLMHAERLSDKIANRIVHQMQLDEVEHHALNSAITQVTSRNYAHHIGAHIKLRTTPQEIKNRIDGLYNAVQWNRTSQSNRTPSSKQLNDLEIDAAIHWLDSMKEHLDQYEVHRNEFLSDPRLPPRNVRFLRDVLLPFCENTLILDNLAKSEGLCYQRGATHRTNRLKVHFLHWSDASDDRSVNGEVSTEYPDLRCLPENDTPAQLIEYPKHFPYLTKNKTFSSDSATSSSLSDALSGRRFKCGNSKFDDFDICLPHEHAFYSILENYIRNAAKHNTVGRLTNGLDIYIDVRDSKENDHYVCTIFDNVSCAWNGSEVEARENECAQLEDILLRKRQRLLQEEGQPNRSNLGMADMKICAHLLASAGDLTEDSLNSALDIVVCKPFVGNVDTTQQIEFTVVDIGTARKRKDVLSIRDLRPGRSAFGYRFKLAKSKKVAWIGQPKESGNEAMFKRHGIHRFATWADYITSQREGLAAYEIAVLEQKVWDKIRLDNKSPLRISLARLPYRVLVNAKDVGHEPDAAIGRRVVFSNPTMSPEIAHEDAMLQWVVNKRRTHKQGSLFLRAVFLAESEQTTLAPQPIRRNGIDAAVFVEKEKGCYDHEGKIEVAKRTPLSYRLHLGRVVTIAHHGNLFKAVNVAEENGANSDEFNRWNLYPNAYCYTDKANRDHDRLRNLAKQGELDILEVLRILDGALLNVIVLDERLGALMSGKSPFEGAKVIPPTQWGYFAASGLFVVTKLSGALGSFEFCSPQGPAALELTVAGGRHKKGDMRSASLTMTFHGDTNHFKTTDPCMLEKDNFLPSADVLIIHRTYWKKAIERKLTDQFFDRFAEIVVTSGAGQHESVGDLKYLSFATLNSFASSTSVSKIALSQVLCGLAVK